VLGAGNTMPANHSRPTGILCLQRSLFRASLPFFEFCKLHKSKSNYVHRPSDSV
jgi:hypothetical protein